MRKHDSSPAGGADPTLLEPGSVAAEEVLRILESTAEQGLSGEEARRRLRHYGPNQLRRTRRRDIWRILWDQFANLIVALLVAAAIAAFAFNETVEGVAILAVILINASIGFLTELNAVRSMEALRELGQAESHVRRDGLVLRVPASQLVPGDIVVLDAGDIPTADMRLISGSRLQADESPLTGESLPVDKSIDPVEAGTPLSERTSMLFKGTALTLGSGEGVVVATGMATELGAISALVADAEACVTPLEKSLDSLARRLIGLTLAMAVLVAVAVVVSGRGLFFAVEMGIALAVATIPEGLPIVATVALARGMWRMAKRNALVEQLSAVETLGATTVLLTDKTGTFTENRMTVVEVRLADQSVHVEGTGLETNGEFRIADGLVVPANEPLLLDALRAGVLCNNATLDRDADGKLHPTGDPTEIALLVVGAKGGLDRRELSREWPEVDEISFDPVTKRMATIHRVGDALVVAVKGAPETVVADCTKLKTGSGARPLGQEDRTAWLAQANEMASSGQRVLALAESRLEPSATFEFKDLVLLGLVGFFDPPRRSVRPAIDACQDAGVRVVMVTGDHGATGYTVAAAVGLIDPRPGDAVSFVDARKLPPFDELSKSEERELLSAAVIARATPRQKLDLIELHQRSGAVVAMTGDGVNDAPALKKADIGVAMGVRGTQVAREAADIVLRDDELGSIVAAIAQGRAIFANIRKFVVYLLSCNVSEIFVVTVGVLLSGPMPLLPLQILFLNLVTDVFPALALGVCEGGDELMREPPRDPKEPLLTRRHWRSILALGAVMAASVFAALEVSLSWLELPDRQAATAAFLTLALAQLWHVFSMRNRGSDWLRNEVTRNPWIWGALALCACLLALAVGWAPLAEVLSLQNPGVAGWLVALGFSLAPLVFGQLGLVRRARQ